MKTVFVSYIVIVSVAIFLATSESSADQTEDEAAIRKIDEAYVAAYNNHDAKAIAAMWSPEAVYVDPDTGEEKVGREEIEKEFADTFAELKDAKIEINVGSIQFMSPNV